MIKLSSFGLKDSLKLKIARYAFFASVLSMLGARDMCFGSGGPPPEDPPDADVQDAPSDAPEDGSVSLGPALETPPARA